MKLNSIVLCATLIVLLSVCMVSPISAAHEYKIQGEPEVSYFLNITKPFNVDFKYGQCKKGISVKRILYRCNDAGQIFDPRNLLDSCCEGHPKGPFAPGKYKLELRGYPSLPCECGCQSGKRFEGANATACIYYPSEESSPFAPTPPPKVVFQQL